MIETNVGTERIHKSRKETTAVWKNRIDDVSRFAIDSEFFFLSFFFRFAIAHGGRIDFKKPPRGSR